MISYKGTEYEGEVVDGVFVTEENIDADTLKHISVHKNRQNIDLLAIKKLLVKKAKAIGGNAVVEFKYGQRQHKPWQHLVIKWDTISWYGEGRVLYIDYEK